MLRFESTRRGSRSGSRVRFATGRGVRDYYNVQVGLSQTTVVLGSEPL